MEQHAFQTPGIDPYLEPERTSIAAILGFIFSIVGCCGGVTALVGVPLSVGAMVNVSRSGGRVGGRGLAIAGLLIGLLNLAVWGGCSGAVLFGIGQLRTQIADPTARMLTSLQDGQLDAARANLIAPAADVSDAELIAFREAYRSTLGDFQSIPSGKLEFVTAYFQLGPIMQSAQGRQDTVPIPATFQGGPALILVHIDQRTAGITEIAVIDTAGNEYTLPMQPGWQSADTPPGTTPPAPPAEPETQTPADDQPAGSP